MQGLVAISLAGPASQAGLRPLDAGLLVSIAGACVTSAMLALIVARVLKLHRMGVIRRSASRSEACVDRPCADQVGALVEPKPLLHHQKAA